MTSFHFELDHPKEEISAAFVAEVGRLLQEALVERKALGRLTQQEIATRLGIDRSRVNKCFSGFSNLSIASLAELCWAMDVAPQIHFLQLLPDKHVNDLRLPEAQARNMHVMGVSGSDVSITDATVKQSHPLTGSNNTRNRTELNYAT